MLSFFISSSALFPFKIISLWLTLIISREIIKVSHKLIILKGKSAEEEIKKLNINFNCSYTLEKSITSSDSKIVIIDFNK